MTLTLTVKERIKKWGYPFLNVNVSLIMILVKLLYHEYLFLEILVLLPLSLFYYQFSLYEQRHRWNTGGVATSIVGVGVRELDP